MTAKYALQEGFVNLVQMKDAEGEAGFGLGVTDMLLGKAKFNEQTGCLDFTGDVNESLAITPEAVDSLGIKYEVIQELYELAAQGKFIIHKPSEFVE